MRVIHVLRKPLSEGTVAANTLKHGTGGLNIDASRIGCRVGGRWPANVILQHLDGCRCDGMKEAGTGERRVNVSDSDHLHGTVHEGYRRPGRSSYTTNVEGTTRQYGKETVANWICEPGCPVARLDGASRFYKQVGGSGEKP